MLPKLTLSLSLLASAMPATEISQASAEPQAAPTSGMTPVCGNGSLIFYCQTNNSKEIKVCDMGKTIKYTFGMINEKPEIVLMPPRSSVRTRQWKGIGRWISYAVVISNDLTTYEVSTASDRMTDQHEFEAGVDVYVDDELITRVPCIEDTTEHRLEGIDLIED